VHSDDPIPRGDFLLWAMGNHRRAVAVVILPVLAGLVFGVITTLLHFGMRYPTFMYMIPWDLTANYECFVLPRNVVRGSLLLAPLAAAVIFWIQPRFRLTIEGGANQARVNGPAIDPPYWLITAFGVLLVFIVPGAFDLYGAGWYFACRIQDLYGVGGRLVLTALIVLVAPAASVAAITLAYQLRRRRPIAAVPQQAAKALRPVGLTLIAAGLISAGYASWIVHKEDPGTALFTGVMYIAMGALIFRGSLGAARLMGWLAASEIAVAFGLALTAPLRLPLGLLQAKLHVEPMAMVFPIAVFFGSFALLLWVYLAVRDKAILAAREAASRSTAWPWTGFAFGALMVGFEVFQIFTMRPADLTAEAERRARAKYGLNYSYYVMSVGVESHNDRVYAQVTGYSRDKVFDADVDWEQ
jgi:hypothetical protein